jgi:hypothetical protein
VPGQALGWYVPKTQHMRTSPEWKRAQAERRGLVGRRECIAAVAAALWTPAEQE